MTKRVFILEQPYPDAIRTIIFSVDEKGVMCVEDILEGKESWVRSCVESYGVLGAYCSDGRVYTGTPSLSAWRMAKLNAGIGDGFVSFSGTYPTN